MKAKEFVAALEKHPSELTQEEQDAVQTTINERMMDGDDAFTTEVVNLVEHDENAMDNLLLWADAGLSGPFRLENGKFAWAFVVGGIVTVKDGYLVHMLNGVPAFDEEINRLVAKGGYTAKLTPFLYDPYLKTDEILSSGHFAEIANSLSFSEGKECEIPTNTTTSGEDKDVREPVNLVLVLEHEDPDACPIDTLMDKLDEHFDCRHFPVSFTLEDGKIVNADLEIMFIALGASAFIDNPYHLDLDNFLTVIQMVGDQRPDFEIDISQEKEGSEYRLYVNFEIEGETVGCYESSRVKRPGLLSEAISEIVEIWREEHKQEQAKNEKDPFAGCSRTLH